MNRNTVIGLVAVIILMPLVYIFASFVFPDEPQYGFRGYNIRPVHPANGVVTVPTIEEDAKGATLHATFKPAFLEKMGGVKAPNPNGLDMTVDSIDDNVRACGEGGAIPSKAGFAIAKTCAEADFAAWKAEKKAALIVDAQQNMIVFGASNNNQVKLYHKNLVATYISPDMVQSDRKKEACIVRITLDHLIGIDQSADVNCASAQ